LPSYFLITGQPLNKSKLVMVESKSTCASADAYSAMMVLTDLGVCSRREPSTWASPISSKAKWALNGARGRPRLVFDDLLRYSDRVFQQRLAELLIQTLLY
jgi:hypothetical protein